MVNARSSRPELNVDREADALYIQIAKGVPENSAVRQESVVLQSRRSEVVFDFAADGRLLGIEILGIEGLIDQDAIE